MIAALGLVIGGSVLLFVKDPPRARKPAAAEAGPKIKSQPLKEFFQSLGQIRKNKVTLYTTLAGSFNYFGGYAAMYFGPAYFQKVYPMFTS